VEQLHHPGALVELDKRRHRGMVEAGIGVADQFGELRLGDAPAQERRHDLHRQIDV
jgi:hypothetical protein